EIPVLKNENEILKEEIWILQEQVQQRDIKIQTLEKSMRDWISSKDALDDLLSSQRSAKCMFGLGFSEEKLKPKAAAEVCQPIRFVRSSSEEPPAKDFGTAQTEPVKAFIGQPKPKVRAPSCSMPKPTMSRPKDKGASRP
ncbi:hypothetical protein, partial [Serratia marcescens]|uniref:hypothetical protein n=1 Tax=Serratia marcescens TaxID=615 RepID=UPI0028129782